MEPTVHASESLTVLVADDIAASRLELMELVRSLGHHPIAASSGEEALRLIDLHAPDVALLDLLMPSMVGFEAAQAIRNRVAGRWLPVIIVSSLEGDEFLDQALAMGAADYLLKPVKPGILRAKLRQYQRVLTMQARLALLAQRHQAIHEHISDALITTDSTGLVQEVNRAARALFDLDDARLARPLYVQDVTGYALQPLLELAQVDMRVASGEALPFAVSCKNWNMGAQEFVTIALHDLSEARRVERMKDEFLATVSHELRTPLTSILAALGLIAAGAGGQLPEPALQLAEVAKRNGDRLSHLIDDMLDLTKLEGNRMPIRLRPHELLPLLRDSISDNLSYAQRGQVQLQLDSAATACRVQVDADRFLQIMANLLSNAIKHSPKGGQVWVRVHCLAQRVQVDVVDQGPGIDAEFKSKLFEKFSQADGSDRRAIGGTGLGLYISRMLIEKMDGSVSALAAPGGGSIFRLSLPRLLQHSERPWLLCLAKDRDLQERMAEWLSELGTVEAVDSVDAAVAAIERLGPPAALLANPQAQGPSDVLCSQLVGLVKEAHVALIGDSLCAGLASRYGMTWLEQSAPRQQTLERVRLLMDAKREE